MTRRLFWLCWWLASVTTGLVAGFMLSHALLLGRFLDWMLATDRGRFAGTYPIFAQSVGARGLSVFYAVCGIQVVAAVALFALSLSEKRHRLGVGIAATMALLWPLLHYGSGFASVEAIVLRSTTAVSAETAARFHSMNIPVHFSHAAMLLLALGALLVIRRSSEAAPNVSGR